MDSEPIMRHAPPLPGAQIMSQRWRDLTFLHWAVDPALVAPLLPRGTRPDLHDGATYVGLIPFRIAEVRPPRGPAIPWLGTFPETNVRLYCVDASGRRGVVFCSLDASRLGVVLAARLGLGIGYMWSRMRVRRTSSQLTYTSTRRAPGPRGAGGRIVVEPGARIAQPSPLEDFLTARWRLYTRHLGRTLCVPNAHEPWPLHRARQTHLDDSLVAAAGFPGVVGSPPDSVLCSPGVNAVFGTPHLA
ncbi:YqjF family protein [Sanguibacter suarezii]|uniref:YqjF family protein n=1 Tax=Sanguibacter suarezii TaxID=60921 RepID=UPI000829D30A|nr:DUF2071 domain-containing protein [Sanguibacter suarezii]